MFGKSVHKLSFIAGLSVLCLSANAQECIIGSGVLVEKNIVTTSDFVNISNDNIAKLVITQNDSNSVRVKVDDNILQYVSLEVEDDTLAIDLAQTGDSSCFTDVTLEVYVSQDDYQQLINTSSGSISSANNIQLDALEVQSTGSGDIRLKGKVDNQALVLEGSGSIYNFGVTSQEVTARNMGSGDIEVTVTDTLTASLEGSGNIAYKGNPPNRFTDENGSGSLIDESSHEYSGGSSNTSNDNTGDQNINFKVFNVKK